VSYGRNPISASIDIGTTGAY